MTAKTPQLEESKAEDEFSIARNSYPHPLQDHNASELTTHSVTWLYSFPVLAAIRVKARGKEKKRVSLACYSWKFEFTC